MGLRKATPFMTVEEYLEFESQSPVKHEFVDGKIFAMGGASKSHNRLILNFARLLDDHLQGTDCAVFASEVKVPVGLAVFYYPDIVVTCDETHDDEYFCREPVLVIEVLSPTTEQTDRREKSAAYRRLSSLREFVLVAQDKMQVEIDRRQDDGTWATQMLAPDDELHLTSIGLKLPVAEFYRHVRFDA